MKNKTDLESTVSLFTERNVKFEKSIVNDFVTILTVYPKKYNVDNEISIEITFDKHGQLLDFGLWR